MHYSPKGDLHRSPSANEGGAISFADNESIAQKVRGSNPETGMPQSNAFNNNISQQKVKSNKKAAGLLRGAGLRLSGRSVLFNGYVHNITDANANINMRFENVTQTQQFKRWFGDWENEKRNNKKVSKVVDDKGKPKKLYHQTDAEIEAFDTSRKGSGYYDSQTPEGIFLKTTNDDIGLKGKKQIEVYADIKNPLDVENRTALETWAKVDSQYKNAIDKKNEARYNELEAEADRLYNENYYKENGEAIWQEAENELDSLQEEWEKAVNKANRKARVRLTELIKSKGYDGVHIKNDEGSFGRNIETWIAFKSNQVKSTDNLDTFDKNNPKIQYSFRDETESETKSDKQRIDALGGKILNEFKKLTGAAKYEDYKELKNLAKEAAWEYAEYKDLSLETRIRLFNNLWDKAVEVDKKYYEENKEIKKLIREKLV